MALETLKKLGEELYAKLHLPTYPVAVTYIKSEDEIPEQALRPSAMGQKMALCQAFTNARSWGAHTAMTEKDNLCVPSSAMHKWINVTDEEFVESQVRQGWHIDRQAEMNRLAVFNHLFNGEEGRKRLETMKSRIGFVCSPLQNALLEPDTILVFGNGVHTTHLIQALCYDYTSPVFSAFEGFGESCAKGGLLPFVTGRPQLVLPGMGDRAFAGIAPDELAMGIPASMFPKMMEHMFKSGGFMNIGMPFKTMMPSGMSESITPGFAYLRERAEKNK
ncbi:Uncharacterized conserved protein, DUF169 family [Desulfatibacillum alkenivorans DSM 16219]|jgi:uncharacterized protein (DUF169 family)|uniref:Uncharacterized conserved protein, DUF169 family n=1 Tax=Desulfatibacillum alkenivorans DSM 16219 TaxID=1121393 RepID=A0A1M6X7J4_9BACT|nr:DUF169 domain-containing protein [Desulfatibacillum alkenivorans]SHL01914.1 Uncharacterized conserved protein, DUF169 family [Desulfatibacillum alkenivorans DSM 16219]